MLKDIPEFIVEDVAVAVVPEENELHAIEWNVYLLNLKKEDIDGVLVSSKGYGLYKGEEVKTSVLRHYLGYLQAGTYVKIEPIIDSLFGLNNEYWVSFFLNDAMYDKKYVFLPESIKEEHYTRIPLLNKPGVMIL